MSIEELKLKLTEIKSDKLLLMDLKELGISKALIEKFYKDPEVKYKNHSGSKFYYLYETKRILEIVSTEEFNEQFQKTLLRSKRGKDLADKIIQQNIEIIKSLDIEVKVIDRKQLKRLAIEAWNNWNGSSWEDKDHTETLRIMENFVRHNLTEYDFQLDNIHGEYGKNILYCILKDKVTEEIYKRYPYLNN